MTTFTRPDCFEFAMGFIGDPEQAELRGYIEALEAELERERLRLAACGVVAMADTPESAARARDMHPDYRSAMTELSPVTQAVVNAAAMSRLGFYATIVAVLRAIAEIDSVRSEALGPCDERYGDWRRIKSISQQDFKYQLASAKKKAQVAVHRQLISIANELEDLYG